MLDMVIAVIETGVNFNVASEYFSTDQEDVTLTMVDELLREN